MKLEFQTPTDQAVFDEILCIADAKLVLAGWYMITVPNGRAIADWSAICGMMQDHYGHARALYGYLERFGLTREQAEWSRTPTNIRSPEVLDSPPRSWADLIATCYLVEKALDTLLGAYDQAQADPKLAGIVRRIGREVSFHFNYLEGWLKVVASTHPADLVSALQRRLEDVLKWWGPSGAVDLLLGPGMRSASRNELRIRFLATVDKDLAGVGLQLSPTAASSAEWNPAKMRATTGGIPEKLFELIRFKHIELALP